MGFSFLFWQRLSISHSCACSPTDAPSVTNTELLSTPSSSPFQANKFIHLVLCCSVLRCWVVKKKKKKGSLTIDLCKAFSPWTRPGDVFCGRKGKVEAVNELDLYCFIFTVGRGCNIALSGSCSVCGKILWFSQISLWLET